MPGKRFYNDYNVVRIILNNIYRLLVQNWFAIPHLQQSATGVFPDCFASLGYEGWPEIHFHF